MITYPFSVPSGVNILPYNSGTNNIGSSSGTMSSIYSNNFIGSSGNITTLNSSIISASTITATNISGANIIFGNSVSFSGVGILGLTNLATINFGISPTINATFIISGVNVTASNNIVAYPSATATPGRTNDDWAWDNISMSAFAGSGTITIYAKTENGSTVMGARNILYTIS